MANDTISQLQKRLAKLESLLLEKTGVAVAPSNDPRDRPDYVERGSDRHAAMLGLKKAASDDDLQQDGWTLEDITQFGPNVTEKYLKALLFQKANELTSPMPTYQSKDPREPFFAPTLWTTDMPLSQLTE